MRERKLGGRDRQGERLTTYDAALIKALGDSTGSSGAGMAILNCSKLKQGLGLCTPAMSWHCMWAAPGKGQEPGLVGSP